MQVGLVSGGAGDCGGPSLPTVFQSVSAYAPWVEAALSTVDSQGHLPEGAAAPGDVIPEVAAAVAVAQQLSAPAVADTMAGLALAPALEP